MQALGGSLGDFVAYRYIVYSLSDSLLSGPAAFAVRPDLLRNSFSPRRRKKQVRMLGILREHKPQLPVAISDYPILQKASAMPKVRNTGTMLVGEPN